MRILFLINIDMSMSGPSVHLLNDIIHSAKKHGHSVTRIEKKYGVNTWNIETISDNNETIYRIECQKPGELSNAKRYINDIVYARKCKLIASKDAYDLVFIQSCNTAIFQTQWIKKLGCPIVYNVQDIFPLDIYYEGVINKKNPIYIVMDFLQKMAYKQSDRIITISEDMRESLVAIGASRGKIDVIYNWAYEDEYRQEDYDYIFAEYFNNSKTNVVYAGNIGVAQNVETVILAAQKLQDMADVHFIIFGAGSRKEQCQRLITKLNLKNLEMHDLVPQKYSQYVYKSADINIVTLIPGIMRTSLPSKTAACFNSGKRVIYCIEPESITLNRMMSASNRIFQCAPGNPDDLAARIVEICGKKKEDSNCGIMYTDIMQPQGPEEYITIFENMMHEGN